MKPIQVGILVAAAAVGGALFMKWQISRNLAPVPATVAPAAAPAAPAVEPAPAEAQTAQQALPSPFMEEKQQPKKSPAPHRQTKAHPAEPQVIAENRPPIVSQAPAAGPAPQPAAPAATAPAKAQAEEPASAPQPPPPPRQVTLTAGTIIAARTVEGLSSERNQIGDTFTATLDQPLVVDGLVIAERGAHLEGKVVQAQRAGRVKGLSNLAIELTQLWTSDGQRVALQTETFEKHGQSSKGEDAAKIGAGAAIGAAIGAIAGGGKGAGIGAGVGGAAGAGDVMVTRGKPAVLPAETRINFRLRNSITLTERSS